jgi:hypothetical protein
MVASVCHVPFMFHTSKTPLQYSSGTFSYWRLGVVPRFLTASYRRQELIVCLLAVRSHLQSREYKYLVTYNHDSGLQIDGTLLSTSLTVLSHVFHFQATDTNRRKDNQSLGKESVTVRRWEGSGLPRNNLCFTRQATANYKQEQSSGSRSSVAHMLRPVTCQPVNEKIQERQRLTRGKGTGRNHQAQVY